MPYIDKVSRPMFDDSIGMMANFQTPGALNYAITRIIDQHIVESGGVNYTKLNEIIGVLECVKLELYRRVAAPYEDSKRDLNGDVYDSIKGS